MPSPTSASRAQNIKGQLEKVRNGGGKITETSASFHGKGLVPNQGTLRTPKTDPELFAGMRNKLSGGISSSPLLETSQNNIPKLTRLLLNVTVQRSLGPIHVVMSPDSTVGDLITMVVKQYSEEGRRPLLSTVNPSDFNLHYSQFSLECLDREEKLIQLGARNFFLCPKNRDVDVGSGPFLTDSTSNQAERVTNKTVKPSCCSFIDFLMITSTSL
ncbi:hypothetical protein MKW94_009664 [Papaver nudicaule]|uniref:DUF7054 domain-containing protein n=1 Tax=Papaver nudicaule TaxID=74823 RepID=A0AA41VFG7_PAPNU|nr:hypothetical protein [Papaver nudicaule]